MNEKELECSGFKKTFDSRKFIIFQKTKPRSAKGTETIVLTAAHAMILSSGALIG